MTKSAFETMRQIIASARSAHGEILEAVRRIDDVIDGVPNEAKQECGDILLDLSHLGEELDRLDELAEQLRRLSDASGND